METKLMEIVCGVEHLNREAMGMAADRQGMLAKPPGSLGRLEELSVQLAGVTGHVHNRVDKRRVIVMAADNGVYEEGVSSSPQSVTLAQTVNLTKGLTGCAVISRHCNTELQVVDVGVNARVNCAAVVDRKIACGTKNLYKEPAMTRQQAVQALLVGVEMAGMAKKDGVQIVGVGEMGICNTTTSSAVLAALTGLDVEKVTGRGGGITDSAFLKKKQVIEGALALHRPRRDDPIDVLSKVGGFDIAAMAGVFLGCAYHKLPVVVDGFISVVAALCAARLCPTAKEYMILSHQSFEIGYMAAAEELGSRPLFDLGMRLGEGSGCPIAFEIVATACAVMNNMATFDEASINDEYLDEIREKDSFTV